MGLKKNVVLPNGISLNYHRIVSVHISTNVQNDIHIQSYISKKYRDDEKSAIEAAQAAGEWREPLEIFVHSSFISAPYDQTMTIQSAYEWLKENAGYEDADDVLEAGQPQEPEDMGPAEVTIPEIQEELAANEPTPEETSEEEPEGE